MGNSEIVEKYSILLIGAKDRLIPSDLHLQKEMFILSNVNPEMKQFFNFERHYKGPYSQLLSDIVEHPIFIENAFLIQDGKIILNKNGQREFEKIIKENSDNIEFRQFFAVISIIRQIYDKLSEIELLFLVYDTFPEYVELSNVSDFIMKTKPLVKRIILSLYRKGLITSERYLELQKRYSE